MRDVLPSYYDVLLFFIEDCIYVFLIPEEPLTCTALHPQSDARDGAVRRGGGAGGGGLDVRSRGAQAPGHRGY